MTARSRIARYDTGRNKPGRSKKELNEFRGFEALAGDILMVPGVVKTRQGACLSGCITGIQTVDP